MLWSPALIFCANSTFRQGRVNFTNFLLSNEAVSRLVTCLGDLVVSCFLSPKFYVQMDYTYGVSKVTIVTK
jgi:hypothetical protein